MKTKQDIRKIQKHPGRERQNTYYTIGCFVINTYIVYENCNWNFDSLIWACYQENTAVNVGINCKIFSHSRSRESKSCGILVVTGWFLR